MKLSPPSVTSGAGFDGAKDCIALVTGCCGLCGSRLVEMLIERGAKKVIGYDIVQPNAHLKERFDKYEDDDSLTLLVGPENGDITNREQLENAFRQLLLFSSSSSSSDDKNTDNNIIIYHIAALVGPFHDKDKYYKVNYDATILLLDLCRQYKVSKFVYSSSPSTRFTGNDVNGLREDEMKIPESFLALYAETKAMGEIKVKEANDPPNLYTISVAPHQVYGPNDNLFLPNLLSTMGNGRLRIFGRGDKLISTCYVDNYCHGLMCGGDVVSSKNENHPALSKFYIVTDDEPQNFWDMINYAGIRMNFVDLNTKFHLPIWLLYGVAYVCNVLGFILNKKFKLNPFNVNMLTINRYFDITNAKRDLNYVPLYKFDDAWNYTIHWFRLHWLPNFLKQNPNIALTNNNNNHNNSNSKKEQ